MALSKLEQALIERLQEPRLDGERLIDGGLTAAANIVHEITRVMAPDDETPADYIRRAVQEAMSDPSMGLELAVEAYKHYSGFQFNAQSGKPTDYLIEMAKRHKQLFEAPLPIDTHPGIREAAMLISNRAGMPLLPGESYGDYLARVADKVHGNYAQGVADIVNKLTDASGISFIGSESSGEYIKRVGEIAKKSDVDAQAGMGQAAMLVSSRAAMPFFPNESHGDFLARVADTVVTMSRATTRAGARLNPRGTATRLQEASGIRFLDDNESYDAYITRVGEIAKRACEPKQAPFTELFELIFDLSGIKPEIKLEDFKENAYEYLTQIAELINKSKKPE